MPAARAPFLQTLERFPDAPGSLGGYPSYGGH